MGIVNITPDSFSDGGCFLSPQAAITQAMKLIEDGADSIDLGAESARPGARPISCDLEWQRLAPVIAALRPRLPQHCRLSIDTTKPELMRRALGEGVTIINNTRGLVDPASLQAIAAYPAVSYIAMHCHGNPTTMQVKPLHGEQAIGTVEEFFTRSTLTLQQAGFREAAIFMDPGIGFGKTDQANLRLMAHTPQFAQRYQLVLGVSRKSWLGRLLELPAAELRDAPSKIAEFTLGLAGAKIIRTHEVRSLARLRQVYTKAEA